MLGCPRMRALFILAALLFLSEVIHQKNLANLYTLNSDINRHAFLVSLSLRGR